MATLASRALAVGETPTLTSLFTDAQVAASTQNQALNTLTVLPYGAGLLLVVRSPRVKDLDFATKQVIVHSGKGANHVAMRTPLTVASRLMNAQVHMGPSGAVS